MADVEELRKAVETITKVFADNADQVQKSYDRIEQARERLREVAGEPARS